MYPGQGPKSPETHSGWELEHRDWRAIPGWGLLLTVGRQPNRTWGRRSWWRMPLEQCWVATEAKRYCWVMCRGQNHHCSFSSSHASAGSWPIEKDSREGHPLSVWGTEQQRRNPSQWRPLSACCAKQQRRASQRGLLNASCQRLEEDCNSALAPALEATSISANLAPRRSLDPSNCATSTPGPH